MRRRIVSVLLVLLLLLLVLNSCKVEVLRNEENINNMLYPYLEFTLSEDGSYYTAEIIENVRLESVEIPEAIDNLGTSIPVRWFKGFKNKEDGKNLKTIVLNSGETNIVTDAISNSLSLVSIEMKVGKSYTRWPSLPVLDNTSEKEFKGWYIYGTETEIVSGEIVNRRNPKITPAWGEHNLTHVEAKAATCLENGWTEYDVCSTCSYNTKKIIPALGHNIVLREEVTPTCTEKGIREHYECTNCHLLFSDSKGENIINEIELPSLGHLTHLVPEKEPKCEAEGTKEHYECERCHHLFLDSNAVNETTLGELKINALGHDWQRKQYSDTNKCTWDECTRCHETTNASGHTWNNGEITKEPTEKEKGIKTFTCTVCNHTKKEDISPLNSAEHTHTWKVKETITPTCVKTGYTVMECSSCKITYNTDYLDALGHDMTEIEEQEATCTSNGHKKHYKCSVCNNLYLDKNGINKTTQQEVEEGHIAQGHVWEKDYKYDETGHWHKCRNCDETTEKVAHVFDKESSIQANAPTCFKDGFNYYACVCTRIGSATYKSKDKLEHIFTTVEGKSSTCEEKGWKTYKTCSRDCCEGMFFDENGNITKWEDIVLPLAPHSFNNKKFYKDENTHTPICDNCGKEIEEMKGNHNSDTFAHDSISHWYACSICEQKMTAEEKHQLIVRSDGSSECTICHAVINEDTKGDSGFGVGVDYQEPKGKITHNKVGTEVTVIFEDLSEKDYKATDISWYLDNVLQEQKGSEFTFLAPYLRHYNVRCSFVNGYGRGNSASLSILGGSN